MYIPRYQHENVLNLLTPGKVVVIYGSRQVGKTTLLKKILESVQDRFLLVSGEDIVIRQYLGSQSIDKLKDFVGDHTVLAVDEAQYVDKIGLNLKLLVDHLPHIKVIATGSSSFELAKGIDESLTGRKFVLKLFPIGQIEMARMESRHETRANLENRLIYGSYPEVITTRDNSRRVMYLRDLTGSYLFKDILQLEGIRYADRLTRLLQLLAFQIGKDVSYTELGKQLGMSKNTVEHYIDLLQKVFVIHKLTGFSRNPRKEISKGNRYFFFDNGIRNTLINNFNPISMRDDVGMLWENYIIMERLKKLEYTMEMTNTYFWRTYDKKEIDLVEESGGKLAGFEITWADRKKKVPKAWKDLYPGASFEVIYQERYIDFIT